METITPPQSVSTPSSFERMRSTWTAGAFGRIAAGYAPGAADFVARLGLRPGERVLDVACGTGNLALPAARAGANVTGLDIARNLLDEARSTAAVEGLALQLDEGNCEELPYAEESFDVAMTMFGAMFAADQEATARELTRVVRRDGRIAMANWTREGFVGRMLSTHIAYAPPPAGAPSPILWGDEAHVAALFGDRLRDLSLTRRMIALSWPLSPEGVVALFRDYYGPTVKAFERVDADRRPAFFEDLVTLFAGANIGSDSRTVVESEYLEVIGVKG